MRDAATEYAIPAAPPAELLADLDAAALVLDELSHRAAELTLEIHAQTGVLRIELRDERSSRALTPSELFELLSSPPL